MAFDYKKFYSELTKNLPGEVSPAEVDFLKRQPMPSRSERPDLFGDLSRVPLGREQAQNTAQMGKSKSNDMQEAFKAVTEGADFFQKPSKPAVTGTFGGFTPAAQPKQYKVDTSMKYFNGGFGYKDTEGGFVPEHQMSDWEHSLLNPNIQRAGFASGGIGAGFQGMPAQTSSSNIVPYSQLGQFAPREATPLEKAQREWLDTPYFRRREYSPQQDAATTQAFQTFLQRK
jgi:hypothetical protein